MCSYATSCDYRMGTNFRGWLNFAVFEGTSQTTKNNPGEILWGYAHTRTRTVAGQGHGKTSSRMALFRYFRPTTDHWRETPCVVFLPHHFVHWSTSTITQLIWKGRGNYTHNKSVKIKTFENLIIKMFRQKHEILTPRNFVPIQYLNFMWLMEPTRHGLQLFFVLVN